MSIHNHTFPSQSHFTLSGPVVEVQVEVPTALAAALGANKQSIPKPVSGLALIDTGASTSAVESGVIQQLGVQPVGMGNVTTPTGSESRLFYPARFSFPGTDLPDMDFQQLLGADLSLQKIHGWTSPLIALIGRDILQHFLLVYNGPSGAFSLAF